MNDSSSDDRSGQSGKKEKNVIEFPTGKDRKAVEKQLRESRKSEEKKDDDDRKNKERLAEDYRRQYQQERAARARLQGKLAQTSANGKEPFINWDKIPPFARYMTGALIVVQIIMSFLVSDADYVYIIMNYGFVPSNYMDGSVGAGLLLLAPFTSLIIHGGWMHIVFNVVMLLAMGIFFERTYGTKRAVIFFLLCGMAGHAAYFLLNPYSAAPVIGASGAISGLFAVTVITMSQNGMMGADAQRRGPAQFIILWIFIIIAMGVLSPGMAWQSHLGGFIGGIGFFHLWKRGVIRF